MPGVNTNTTLESEPYFTSDHRTFIYFAVVSVFIVLGNAVTLVVICKKRRKKPTDLLLGVLAVTDLLIPVLVFPLLIAHGITGRWSGGRPTCYLNAFASMLLLKVSMFIACIIAVDRFLAIDKPFIYRSKINLTRVKIAVVIVGFYSLSVSLIPLVGMICGRTQPNWHLCFYHWAAERADTLTSIYVVLNVVDTSLAALAVLVCNIGVIIYFLKKRKTRKVRSVVPSSGNESAARESRLGRRREDLKYARLMVVVSLYFLLCFIPIQVLIILYQYGGISLEPQSIVTYQLHIVSINLLFNPLLHALIRKQYRNAYWFILRHPTVLCGCSTNHHSFDFDQNDPVDPRAANLRELSLAVIAVSRFRANGRRIHTGSNGTVSNLKTVPKIVEFNSETTVNSTLQGRFLSSFSSCADSDLGQLSSATECSESIPANQLQVPSIPLRCASGTSYFSEPDSLPPSPLLHVPLPNFIEERDTNAASDLESDAATVCSHLANESRLSVPSIFSESPSDETPQSTTAPLCPAPAQTSPNLLPDNTSQESGSVEEGCLQESDTVKTAWLPEEYIKPAQEIDGIVVKRSKKKKKRKRKMTGASADEGTPTRENVPM